MRIRRAETNDAHALMTIRRDAILTLATPAMSRVQAEQWANNVAPERISRALREHNVWVAVEEKVLAWVETNADHVAALYVSPSASGRGVGSALLGVAEGWLLASGHELVHLIASSNAVGFYRGRGYVNSGGPDADGAWPLCKRLRSQSHG
jgi:GNAT superfamily N-acetyltransferase